MKAIANVVGILLIVFGVLALGYQGYTYTERQKVLQVGSLQVSADTQKTVYFPPWLGGAALVAGIVLVVIGRKK